LLDEQFKILSGKTSSLQSEFDKVRSSLASVYDENHLNGLESVTSGSNHGSQERKDPREEDI
jgi:hypothetical protein